MKRKINSERKNQFRKALYKEEKEITTIHKYMRDLEKMEEFLKGEELSKEKMIQYKEYLQECGKYKVSSINSFLAAANHFCKVMKWEDICIKALRVQKESFCSEKSYLSQAEYERLVKVANKHGKQRLALILQTIGSTGIRISELSFITVESLKSGMTDIYNKGKQRKILFPAALKKILMDYVMKQHIEGGAIFQTSSGKPLDRSNIWKEMKALCKAANVDAGKVFPHNLRHLFARNFYRIKKDIAKLADVLGHSNIETTRIYIKSTGIEHRRQLDSMKMIITT